MFKKGDAVVHPIHGAGVIRGIVKRQWHGDDNALFYKIRLLSQPGSSLILPISAAKELGVRRAASQSRLRQVWRVLRTDPDDLPDEHKERYQMLENKLYTGDILLIAEAVRDMTWRQLSEGRLTTRGKRIYDEGMALLAGEIAVSQGIDVADAEAEVKARLTGGLPEGE